MEDSVQLLQKIADNTSHDDSWWIALISGGAGVLGAGLTAFFSYRMAIKAQHVEEKRLRAEIITTERLRWLQDIRQRLSHFYVQLDMQYNYLKRPIPDGKFADYQERVDTFSNQINEQCNVMTLMLNPEKVHQADLRKVLHEAIGFLRKCTKLKKSEINFDDVHYTKIKQTAFDSLVAIGVETWDQVKRLE